MLNFINSLMGNTTITTSEFIFPIIASLIMGFALALVHMYKNKYSKSFVATIAILPAIVCVIIMAVNGNIGAGIAVAGAFSLVRFRSAQGNAKEIGTLFAAMALGLLTGMGYIIYAFDFLIIIGLMIIFLQVSGFGADKNEERKKSLRIMIPEELDYTEVFADIFDEYMSGYSLVSSRTANMGSLYKLDYEIILKDTDKEKELMDKIRCRNGNLEISISSLKRNESMEL